MNKIIWIAAWTTLAYWLGGAVGCAGPAGGDDQNYRVLDEDTPILQESPPNKPAGQAHPAEEAILAAALAADPAPAHDAPSLQGIDRSHWERTPVSYELGLTTHGPVYFYDCPIEHPEAITTLTLDPKADLPVESYLAGERPGNWDSVNAAGFFVQPVKFCFDLGVLPVNAVLDPPFFVPDHTP